MVSNVRFAICLTLLFSAVLTACGRGLSSSVSGNSPGTSSSGNPGSSGSQPGGGSSGGSGAGSGSSGGSSPVTASGGQYIYIGDPDKLQIDGFKVNGDGTLLPVPGSPFQMPGQGEPFQTAGNTLAVVGQFLFANATSGPSGLSGFKIDSTNGSLTPVNTSSNTTGSWFLLAGNSQQNVLYTSGNVNMVSNGGFSSINALAAYSVASDGSLTPVSTVEMQNNQPIAGAIAVDHQSRFLYSWVSGRIYVFTLNGGAIGSQVSGSPFMISTAYQPVSPSDPNACFGASFKPVLAVDPAGGRFLYASCDANAQVDEIAVSDAGQLSLIGTVPSPGPSTELSSLTVSGDGALLFGTEEEANNVLSFKIDRSTGQLTLAGTEAAGTRPNQAASDASSRFLYATNGSSNVSKNNFHPGSNNVSEYAVMTAGMMTPLSDSPKTVGSRPASVISVKF
jgi:Lactonase, 7-bladed beta-propeller